MNARRFGSLTQGLARRRTRRAALGGAGAGLAAAALGAAGLGNGRAAQDATPAAAGTPPAGAAGDRTFFLFVQTFRAGTIVPKPGEDGVYTLILERGPAQTVYFSDRPERIVGTVPTVEFLDALGFTPANPPNAALVAQTAAGENVVVLELFNPVYTESFGEGGTTTLTYEVRVLAEYDEEGLAHLAERATDGVPPETFGEAALFIDDCPDITSCFTCDAEYVLGPPTCEDVGPVPGGPYAACWSWLPPGCFPCSDHGDLGVRCRAAYPDRCAANGCGAH